LLPLPRDAEEGDARILAALNDAAVVACVAQRSGNDLAAAGGCRRHFMKTASALASRAVR
jgi:hypothetical protein